MKSVLILPVNVVIVIPCLILYFTDDARVGRPGGCVAISSITGVLLLLPGLILIVSTIRLFVRIGKGTLAPWDPTSKLVIEGAYAHVRNPMIGGVLLVLLGEGMIFGSVEILAFFFVFLVGNAVYFKFSEEPGLVKRFGDEYIEYQQNVPRWIPRLTPWKTKKR